MYMIYVTVGDINCVVSYALCTCGERELIWAICEPENSLYKITSKRENTLKIIQ
jgi:hypothetical protein